MGRRNFRPNIERLKGKTMRTTQKHVEMKLQDVSWEIMKRHGEVTLAIDLMFVNKKSHS